MAVTPGGFWWRYHRITAGIYATLTGGAVGLAVVAVVAELIRRRG
jgi:hypothetical protein